MLLADFIADYQRIDPEVTPDEIADALWLAGKWLYRPLPVHSPVIIDPPPPPEPPPIKPGEEPGNEPSKPPSEFRKPPELRPRSDPEKRSFPLVPPKYGSEEKPNKNEGLSLRVPGAQALPGALELGRAFRPLMRRVPSRILRQLDEDATVRRVAEESIWVPVLRPARTRWLEVALLVDRSPSMLIWEQTVDELRQLLERQGAFRDVRTWTLNTSRPDQVTLHARKREAERKPKELIDAAGRRIVIVVTDCLGAAWSGNGVRRFLKDLGTRNPVVCWQMLPQSHWRRTALRGCQVAYASAVEPAAPNHRLKGELWRPQPGEKLAEGLLLPMITVEPNRVRAWARLIAGAPRLRQPAVVLAPVSRDSADAPFKISSFPIERTPRQLIEAFRRVAQPLSFRLACVLAGAPLRLPIMRLVQRTMVPASGQTHLAEVFLSGLIDRITPENTELETDFIDFDFSPGVRDALLDGVWAPEAADVQAIVSDYLQQHFGQSLDFRAIIANPQSVRPLSNGSAGQQFATVTAAILRRLGGEYEAAANVIEPVSVPEKPAPVVVPPAAVPSEVQPATAAPMPIPGKLFAGVRILWVDDYPRNNLRPTRSLIGEGASIKTALSTQEALKILQRDAFDAVISDLGRSEGSFAGLDLLRALRERGDLSPFAIYASQRALQYRDEALQLGAVVSTNVFSDVREALIATLGLPRQIYLREKRAKRLVRAVADAVKIPRLGLFLVYHPRSPEWSRVWKDADHEEALRRGMAIITAVAATGYQQIFLFRNSQLELVAEDLQPHHRSYNVASADGVIGQAFREARIQWVFDVKKEPSYIAAEPGTRSELAIPLKGTDGSVIGVINIESETANAFTQGEIEWLEGFAEAFGAVLARADATNETLVRDWTTQACSFSRSLRTVFAVRCALRIAPLARYSSPQTVQLISSLLELAERWSARGFRLRPHVRDVEIMKMGAQAESPKHPVLIAAFRAAQIAYLKDSRDDQMHGLVEAACAAVNKSSDTVSFSEHTAAIANDLEFLQRLTNSKASKERPCTIGQVGPLWQSFNPPSWYSQGFAEPRAWILIAGLGSPTLDRELETLSAELGTLLAAAGFGLVCGGWPGVDAAVLSTFVARLKIAGLNPDRRVRLIMEPGRSPVIPVGDPLRTTSIEQSINESVKAVQAVILLSGAGGTARIARYALKLDVPVLPLSITGGDAAMLFEQMRTRQTSNPRLSETELESLGTSYPHFLDNALEIISRIDRESPKTTPSPLGPRSGRNPLIGPNEIILRIGWHPRSQLIATCSVDTKIRIWDSFTGRLQHTLEGHNYGVNQAAWSPDGAFIASSSFDRTIRIWSADDWKCVHILKGHSDDITDVAWAPVGQKLASVGADGVVNLWNPETGLHVARIAHHSAAVRRTVWLANDTLLAYCSMDEHVRVLDTKSNKVVVDFTAHASFIGLDYNPATDRLAATSMSGALWVWNRSNGRQLFSTKGNGRPLRSVAFSPSGRLLATNSSGPDGEVVIWRTDTWQPVHSLSEPTSGFWPCSIAWSPDGNALATMADRDCSVRFMEIDEANLLKRA